jgi:hypothetical protein
MQRSLLLLWVAVDAIFARERAMQSSGARAGEALSLTRGSIVGDDLLGQAAERKDPNDFGAST